MVKRKRKSFFWNKIICNKRCAKFVLSNIIIFIKHMQLLSIMPNKLLSIVVPAYNEEDRIVEALKRLKALKFDSLDYKKEIIVVNDGSKDKTKKILLKEKGIVLINLPKNRGKGFALRKGFQIAKGDVICIQDADLEYADSSLKTMLKEIVRGENVVYGSRFKGKFENMSKLHLFGNKFLTISTKLLFFSNVSDMETALKMFRAHVLKSIKIKSNSFDFEPEVTAKVLMAGHKIKEIPVKYVARHKAEKKISWVDGLKAFGVLLKCRLKLL
jgi:glycosyltransferase involved in cell wall biosynthesis